VYILYIIKIKSTIRYQLIFQDIHLLTFHMLFTTALNASWPFIDFMLLWSAFQLLIALKKEKMKNPLV